MQDSPSNKVSHPCQMHKKYTLPECPTKLAFEIIKHVNAAEFLFPIQGKTKEYMILEHQIQ